MCQFCFEFCSFSCFFFGLEGKIFEYPSVGRFLNIHFLGVFLNIQPLGKFLNIKPLRIFINIQSLGRFLIIKPLGTFLNIYSLWTLLLILVFCLFSSFSQFIRFCSVFHPSFKSFLVAEVGPGFQSSWGVSKEKFLKKRIFLRLADLTFSLDIICPTLYFKLTLIFQPAGTIRSLFHFTMLIIAFISLHQRRYRVKEWMMIPELSTQDMLALQVTNYRQHQLLLEAWNHNNNIKIIKVNKSVMFQASQFIFFDINKFSSLGSLPYI